MFWELLQLAVRVTGGLILPSSSRTWGDGTVSWAETGVAAALGFESISEGVMAGELAGRSIQVVRHPRLVKVALSPDWLGVGHLVIDAPWFRAETDRILQGLDATVRDGFLRYSLESWPTQASDLERGAEVLRGAVGLAVSVAVQLDAVLEGAIQELLRRDERLGQLGLVPDGDAEFSGCYRGCDVKLEKQGTGPSAVARLTAWLGPDWPKDLLILDRRPGLHRIRKSMPGPEITPPALAHALDIRCAAAARTQRLLGRGPLLAALLAVFSRFPYARVEEGSLVLTLGSWDARVDEWTPALDTVAEFITRVQHHTDWPGKRRGAERRSA